MALFNVSKGLMDAVKGVVGNSIQDYVEEQKKVDRMVAEKVLSAKQKKIAAMAGDPNKIDAEDFAKLRAGKKVSKEESDVKEAMHMKKAEERDTPGQHCCAVHVKHSRLGEGKTLHSQHATPNADGLIEWYDVMFEHGIEKRVPITELEVLVSEMHMNHKKKKGM
jgi:hypothetical protein